MTLRCMAWLLLFGGLGCSGQDAPQSAEADVTAPRLEVGYSALRISLPVFVAQERGLFTKHGLDVTLRRYETAQPLVEEVLDGRVLAGGFAALPIVFTAASRDDSDVRIATAMVEDPAHPVSYLLRRAQDDSLSGPEDLAGRSVAILPTVAYQRWLDVVLRNAGVDPDAVTVMPIAPPQQLQALAGGGADVLFTNDPMATAALASGVAAQLGAPGPVPRALGGSLVFGSFLVHPRLARERPEDVARLLAALDEAIDLIEADQAAAREAMTNFVRAPEREHVAHYPPAHYLRSDQFDDAALTVELEAMVRVGILAAAPRRGGWVLSRSSAATAGPQR